MTAARTLDLDKLIAPIRDDQPAGPYLKQSDYSRFQAAKDARGTAMSLERKQLDQALYTEADLEMLPPEDLQTDPPNWRLVRDLCVEAIASHSKDLWLASWLIEANTRLAGYAGLRDGFELATELVRRYWDAINPPVDADEAYLDTVSQLGSLNGDQGAGTLIFPIQCLSLLPGRDHDEFSGANYLQATTKGAHSELSESQFQAAAREFDGVALREHGEAIQAAIDAYESLIATLEEKLTESGYREQVPPSSEIRKTLQDCQRFFGQITRDLITKEDPDAENSASEEAPDEALPSLMGDHFGGGPRVGLGQSQVTNREDAFRMLLRASEFFRKTEPHSPVSYMLQQAVRFGRMELPELLQELISDEDVLAKFAERTGIELKKLGDDD